MARFIEKLAVRAMILAGTAAAMTYMLEPIGDSLNQSAAMIESVTTTGRMPL